ncbi:MAG: Flp pilus assembly complex ATPase component TadA [Clostridiales bacterium]|nr:Flp pilus assembly complex ATPase component TadA [Clostridiales bacterium]
MSKKRIGDLLIDAGIISEEQLDSALEIQKRDGGRLGKILINNNMASETQIMEVLEFQLGIPFIDLTAIEIPPEVQRLIPYQLIYRHNVVPVKLELTLLYVAMEDPLNFIAIEDLRMATNLDIVPVISFSDAISATINKLYGSETADKAIQEFQEEKGKSSANNDTVEIDSLEVDSAPIVRLVNSTVEQAAISRASDIHIEPLENDVRVRYRIDGKLQAVQSIPKEAQSAVVTRIKILSGLDIAEKRKPQDGRFDFRNNDKILNLRVSIIPTINGEKVVMRILDKTNFLIPKEKLGFTEGNLAKFDELLKNPNGIILITGPTGSGKSTTLYTMLSELNEITDNIMTVEDPVEYVIDGLNQVQVNTKAGLTFAGALRSFLRQDPDIIMLGEIRDAETVEVAIRAAITGHLVLSTLHTNDAVSSVSRLIDMGVAPYMIAVSLMGVISQRLVRRLCPNCAKSYTPAEHELQFLNLPPGDYTFKSPVGCSTCNNSGYKGRLAVHEILIISQEMRDMIAKNVSNSELADYAMKHGLTTLKQESIRLLKDGVTSFDEVMAITFS